MRLAINGFGRIGRNVLKILMEKDDVEIVAINDITDSKTLAHLLKHDSSYGTYNKAVDFEDDAIIVGGQKIKILAEKDPANLPWKDLNIMKMQPEDLPVELPDSRFCFTKEMAMQLTKRYPIRWYDIEVEKKFAELGKPLSRLPFRSTIYVLGTGANISSDDPINAAKSKRRFHPIAFLRKINLLDKKLLTKRIKEEFGMPL